jgi:uncharacterized protein YdiU (UPF0061 family)
MKLNDFNDLFLKIQAEALANTVEPTLDSVYRRICRTYSKEFHTPLHQVFELPFAQVLLNVLEERFSYQNIEDEKFLIQIQKAIDPNFEEEMEEDLKEWIEKIEEEERQKRQSSKLDTSKSSNPAIVSKTYDIENDEDEVEQEIDLSELDDLDYE